MTDINEIITNDAVFLGHFALMADHLSVDRAEFEETLTDTFAELRALALTAYGVWHATPPADREGVVRRRFGARGAA